MFLSPRQPTRRNIVHTSNVSWFLRRKHTTQTSFHISSDICSRLLGVSIYVQLCCNTYFAIRKHAKVSGEGAVQASNISNTEIEAAKQEWADLVLSEDE